MCRYQVPPKELKFSFSKSSGSGGQNVNKVNTKVTLQWDLSKNHNLPQALMERFIQRFNKKIYKDNLVKISSQRYRDQSRNIVDCIQKLQGMIDKVSPSPKKRKTTQPTKASKEKRLSNKRKHSEKKQMRRENYD